MLFGSLGLGLDQSPYDLSAVMLPGFAALVLRHCADVELAVAAVAGRILIALGV